MKHTCTICKKWVECVPVYDMSPTKPDAAQGKGTSIREMRYRCSDCYAAKKLAAEEKSVSGEERQFTESAVLRMVDSLFLLLAPEYRGNAFEKAKELMG